MIQKQLIASFLALCGFLFVIEDLAAQTQLAAPRLNGNRLTNHPIRESRYTGQDLRREQLPMVDEPADRAPIRLSRVAKQRRVAGTRSASRDRGYRSNDVIRDRRTRPASYGSVYGRPGRTSPGISPGIASGIIQEEIIEHDHYFEDTGCGDCGECDLCQVYCPPYQLISFADMEYSVGVQGFKGVPNLGQSGSFGFNQGINWGFPVPLFPLLDLSGQIGVRFAQSSMYGANFTNANRDQTFLTAGISRRVDFGLQLGVVVDFLDDNWYYDASFTQLRSELSLVGSHGNEIGFRMSSNMKDNAPNVAAGLAGVGFGLINNFEPIDTYRFFCRKKWDPIRGGYGEAFAGFSENSDGLVGTKFLIPIAERWSLTSDFAFLIPSSSNTPFSPLDEGWNVGMSLTWYPKGQTKWSKLYHRPLFNVADNGTFMFQR